MSISINPTCASDVDIPCPDALIVQIPEWTDCYVGDDDYHLEGYPSSVTMPNLGGCDGDSGELPCTLLVNGIERDAFITVSWDGDDCCGVDVSIDIGPTDDPVIALIHDRAHGNWMNSEPWDYCYGDHVLPDASGLGHDCGFLADSINVTAISD